VGAALAEVAGSAGGSAGRSQPGTDFGHQRRRTLTPEEFGRLLAACRPFYRDHFVAQVGTGLRSGELLGLRRRRGHPELGKHCRPAHQWPAAQLTGLNG
jgi:hypothetical protein